MKLFTFVAIFGTTAVCTSDYYYIAPTASDSRGPCPMVNALANYGYLPRDGLNISLADLVVAFNESVNLAPEATELVGAKALLTSTTGDSDTFNIADLDQHGIIEHDGSLSRNDYYFGNDHSFNATIWDSVAAWFTNSTITLSTAIEARSSRIAAAAAVNPDFNLTGNALEFSGIETALYMTIFADPDSSSEAVTEWVQTMFVDEKLPCDQGWTRSETQITADTVLALAEEILELSA